ncbi:MAG: tRNA (adenosine(37)-N6)-threonylcarbamoyltransferase complex dimerization subunit type 1 TsaB [Pseudomonadota bacterium]
MNAQQVILAIDTSAGQCAVALSGPIEVAKSQQMSRGHAEALFPMIEDALASAGLSYGDVQRIGVCTGPGSFTGVRVAVAAARGLALGLGVPSIGVTRFEALAPPGWTGTVTLPARGGTIWSQAFNDGAPCGYPSQTDGVAEDLMPDPLAIARIAAARTPGLAPAPLYLRGADAALPSVPAPVLLD